MTTIIGRLHDGRPVTLKRITHTKTEVTLAEETIGYIHKNSRPQRDAITTQLINTRYGEGIARSIGFGNKDIYTTHNTLNHQTTPREYDNPKTAAMTLAREASR